MQYGDMRTACKSKYKYVCVVRRLNEFKLYYKTNMRGLTAFLYDNEREAALIIDKYLISKGKKPVNILVKKEHA